MKSRDLRRAAWLAGLSLGLICGAISVHYGYAQGTNAYPSNLRHWTEWSAVSAVLLAVSLLVGTANLRMPAAVVLIGLLAIGVRPALRMAADPIDWTAKTYDQYPGPIFGNADLCEPSETQLAIDRRHSGSREALWHLADEYTFCDMNPIKANRWLRKLADRGDARAKQWLQASAEASSPDVTHEARPGRTAPPNG